MAPIFAALVYLGRLPDMTIAVIGGITVFAGYTAVYALNDLAGYNRITSYNVCYTKLLRPFPGSAVYFFYHLYIRQDHLMHKQLYIRQRR